MHGKMMGVPPPSLPPRAYIKPWPACAQGTRGVYVKHPWPVNPARRHGQRDVQWHRPVHAPKINPRARAPAEAQRLQCQTTEAAAIQNGDAGDAGPEPRHDRGLLGQRARYAGVGGRGADINARPGRLIGLHGSGTGRRDGASGAGWMRRGRDTPPSRQSGATRHPEGTGSASSGRRSSMRIAAADLAARLLTPRPVVQC